MLWIDPSKVPASDDLYNFSFKCIISGNNNYEERVSNTVSGTFKITKETLPATNVILSP
jgi:hypothetical protein